MIKDNLLAIVVSFNCNEGINETVSRLCAHVSQVLIVDNGSVSSSLMLLNKLSFKNLKIIELRENFGIGYALNIGVRHARENGFPWILTMDQDTIIDEAFVNSMRICIERFPEVQSLAPVVVLNDVKKAIMTDAEVMCVITSGHVVSTSVFERVGLYNEELFIDCVDFDFCLRLRNCGVKTIRVGSALIRHELGGRHENTGWLSSFYSLHTPIRRYYIYRNFIYIIRTYMLKFPLFIIKFAAAHILMISAIILYEKQPWRNIKAISRGLKDGVAGRYGKVGGESF
jgi:rhamnosyltransferase